MITPTGKGLSVCLNCKHSFIDNWMSFASWYSFSRNLPDAHFHINFIDKISDMQLFLWTTKCSVIIHKNKFPSDFLELSPAVMAIREFQGNLGPFAAKDDQYSTLVDYTDGCGDFILNDWNNKLDIPFNKIKQFTNNKYMSINEIKIFDLWRRCSNLYNFIN